ncbi:MAG: hypothetical protein KDD69_01080 [Bdellovibrionales bacterium]|nr:hypothetical protein [Bdellovibrionales bacterium]
MKTRCSSEAAKSWWLWGVSFVVSILLFGAFSGCSKRYHDLPAYWAIPISDPENQSVGRFKTSYLADQIHAYFKGSISGPIAVTTFVDIDNLYQSSSFGRVLSEQLMSELAMRGYNVVEVRASDAMQIMFDKGEFGLSRDTRTLRGMQDISALVVGTYTVSPVRVYLNTRVLDPRSSLVISAGSVEMTKTDEITRLLRTGSFPTALERIPVRHLGYSQYPVPYYWPGYGYGAPAPRYHEEEGAWTEPAKPAPEPELPAAHSKKKKSEKARQLADAELGS